MWELVRVRILAGLKLNGKYLGPYRVVEIKDHGRYEVEKIQ